MRYAYGARGWREFRKKCLLSVPLVVAALCGTGLPAAPAYAQTEGDRSPAATPAPVCRVETSDTFGPAVGDAKPVTAVCRGRGLLLGYADRFEVFTHEALQSVLVDMRRGPERRVLLISLQSDGPPLLEDLSGQISMTAGRGPMLGLEGIEIDVAGFSRNGLIGVRGQPEENGGTARTGTINLDQQIANVRSSRGGQSAPN